MPETATAQELIDNPNLSIDPITARSATKYTDDELRVLHIGENDLDKTLLKIWNPDTGTIGNKKTSSEDVRAAVIDAEFEEAIDATPTFTLTLHDPDWELLNTGALDHTIDINPGEVPRRWYRLQSVGVQDDTLTLTFITRNAAYLSYHTKPYAISRNRVTRAVFILTMLHHVKKKGVIIKLFCPKLRVKQAIAKTKPSGARDVNARRGPGFDDKVKLKVTNNDGSEDDADSGQIKVLEEALTAAQDSNATPRAMVAGIMVVMIETDTGHGRNKNPKYVGVYQQDPRWWPATGDVYKDGVGANGKEGFWPKIVAAAKASPHGDLGAIGASVQNPGDDLYVMKLNRARPNAEKVVKEWTGGAGADDVTWASKFEYMVGPPDGPRGENYLEATYRLAEQVNWRSFWVRDVLHYQSDEDLMKSKARARLRRTSVPSSNGSNTAVVESVSATWDRGRKVNQMTIRVRMENWVAPVGTVVIFDEGGPLKGRWLVTNIRKSVFDSLGDITLSAPVKAKKEPAHDMKTHPKEGGDAHPFPSGSVDTADGAKGIVEAALAIAQGVDGEIYAASSLRPVAYLGGGCLSDHSEDNEIRAARDIAVKGIDALVGPPNPRLDEAMKRIAEYFGWTYTKGQTVDAKNIEVNGYRVQFIWRTPKYGGHMGHIHVGARKDTQNCKTLSSANKAGTTSGPPQN